MAGLHAHRLLQAGSGGSAMACISVHRVKDGSHDHYYTLDYINPLNFTLWLRYRRNFLAHVKNRPNGRVWVEVPNHPLKSRRARRRYA